MSILHIGQVRLFVFYTFEFGQAERMCVCIFWSLKVSLRVSTPLFVNNEQRQRSLGASSSAGLPPDPLLDGRSSPLLENNAQDLNLSVTRQIVTSSVWPAKLVGESDHQWWMLNPLTNWWESGSGNLDLGLQTLILSLVLASLITSFCQLSVSKQRLT